MDSQKNLAKSLSSSDYSYTWIHIFFWISEFFVSFGFYAMKQSIDLYNMEFFFVGSLMGELQPASMLLLSYVTDSYVGKYIMFHVTSIFMVVGSIILLIAYSLQDFSSTFGICLVVFVVIGKGWHPLRYAIVYSQLAAPVNKIRRFTVVHVAFHALGEALSYLLYEAKLSRKSQIVWLSSQLIATTAAFYITVVALYKYQYLNLHFKEYATEKAILSVHRALRQKQDVKGPQRRISVDESKYAMGLLFVFIVLVLCTMIYFDSCIVKYYLGEYRYFIHSTSTSPVLPVYFMFYLGGVVLMIVIEFLIIPIFSHFKIYVSYISMITMAFIMATAALVTLGILSVKIGFAAPFPVPHKGEAHLTIFNCLPVMTELEWPDGRMYTISANSYHRFLNIPVTGGETMNLQNMGIFNTAFGLYELANFTIEADKENVIVVKNNGASRVNLSSMMIHTRKFSTKGQIRILDCLEKCCHGELVFERRGINYITHSLTNNIMSDKLDLQRGLYQIFYSPNKKQKVLLGEVNIVRTTKLVLMIHSLKNPGVKPIHFTSMEFEHSGYYFPLILFRAMIYVFLEPYVRLLIILKTDSAVYTVMFGILLSLQYLVEFISFHVYPTFSSFYLFYVTVILFTGLFLFFFLFLVIKMNRYVMPNMPITLRTEKTAHKTATSAKKPRISASSGFSKDSEALSSRTASNSKFKII